MGRRAMAEVDGVASISRDGLGRNNERSPPLREEAVGFHWI